MIISYFVYQLVQILSCKHPDAIKLTQLINYLLK